MIPRTRVVLEQCIETGARLGYHRAFKHTDSPSESSILEAIELAIMNEIYEYFSFEETEN